MKKVKWRCENDLYFYDPTDTIVAQKKLNRTDDV